MRVSSWNTGLARAVLLFLAAFLVSVPAQAQFSDGFKFLEAVRKKDGQKVADALTEPGSNIINSRDLSSGQTALHIVTTRRDITWLRYMVQEGAEVNARDRKGQTALQIATNLGWVEGVEYLVGAHADLNESNDTGETPLITAVHRKNTALMRVLLQAGADPDRSDNSGRSARDYALLDGKSSPLVSTIDSYAKKGESKKSQTIYGPVF